MPQSTSCFHISLGCVKPVPKPNSHKSLLGSDIVNQRTNLQFSTVKTAMRLPKTRRDLSIGSRNMNLRLLFPKQGIISKIKWSLVPGSWMQGCATAGLVMGLTVCNSTTEPVHAETKENTEDDCSSSTGNFSHGKQVHTDYSVTGELSCSI